MPHFIVEYSANLREDFDAPGLFQRLRDSAVETGIFPLGGIRVRAICCEEYLIADGDPENSFVHVTVKIGHGRTPEIRREAAEKLFKSLTEYLQPIFARRPLGISLELKELHPELSFKLNNIHQRLKSKRDSSPA